MKILPRHRQAQLEKTAAVLEMRHNRHQEPELLVAAANPLGREHQSAKLSQGGKRMETEVHVETFP